MRADWATMRLYAVEASTNNANCVCYGEADACKKTAFAVYKTHNTNRPMSMQLWSIWLHKPEN